jgi:hypothetical protein
MEKTCRTANTAAFSPLHMPQRQRHSPRTRAQSESRSAAGARYKRTIRPHDRRRPPISTNPASPSSRSKIATNIPAIAFSRLVPGIFHTTIRTQRSHTRGPRTVTITSSSVSSCSGRIQRSHMGTDHHWADTGQQFTISRGGLRSIATISKMYFEGSV